MNETRFNPRCYNGTEWSGRDDGVGSGDDDDDDPSEVQLDDGDDGDDFPLREGIPPADFSLPESFSLSGVFRPVEAAEYFDGRSPGLRIPRGSSTRRGEG